VEVISLPPWTDCSNYIETNSKRTVLYLSDQNWFHKAFTGQTKKRDYFLGCSAYAYATPDNLYGSIQFLTSGRPVIVANNPIFSEVVINGFNGYIVSDIDEAAQAYNQLKKPSIRNKLSYQARELSKAILDHKKYLDKLLKATKLKTKFLLSGKNYQERSWIILERYFESGNIKYYPEYHKSFQKAEVYDFIDIIKFFSTQLFREVYVFGIKFPKYNAAEMQKLRILINRLGNRARKIHFCLDEKIPDDWKNIFTKLSLISVQEGLKQVK